MSTKKNYFNVRYGLKEDIEVVMNLKKKYIHNTKQEGGVVRPIKSKMK